MDFYTHFHSDKKNIYISGYKNNKKIYQKFKLKPYLFIHDKESEDYKDLSGLPVSKKEFNTRSQAMAYIEKYRGVENFDIFGSTFFDYVWINDNFKEIKSDNTVLRYGIYDIETDSEGGFADLEKANKEITAISMSVMGEDEVYCLGYKDYDPKKSDILEKECPGKKFVYIKCKNENQLLKRFVELWNYLNIDIITGYNINLYDHPYVIRRIIQILGEEWALKLSPYGQIKSSNFVYYGKNQTKYEIVGIPTLDYFDLYQKFSYKDTESYKLDYICKLELDKGKLDYSEYKTLANLYKENPAKFYDYSIIDTVRIEDLENKLKFIDQVFSLTHFTKCNLLDCFGTVRMCDVLTHNFMMEEHIVIPIKKDKIGIGRQIAGGYVKPVKKTMAKYMISFDFTSLYPHIIKAFNISPEKYVGKIDKYDSLQIHPDIINGSLSEIRNELVDNDLCITGKGTVFSRDGQGFFPKIMTFLFNKRNEYKSEMSSFKKRKELITQELSKRGSTKLKDFSDEKLNQIKKQVEYKVTEFHNKQIAIKYVLNSFYGQLANEHSRWFDENIAESITMSGQLSINWVKTYIDRMLNEYCGTKDEIYVIGVDTDSCYVSLENVLKINNINEEDSLDFLIEFVDYIQEKIINHALEELYKDTNIFEKCLYMKPEIIGRGLWRKAKNYIMGVWWEEGIRLNEEKIAMKGIEAVKSSTPEICRNKIKDAAPILLDNDSEKLLDFVEEFRSSFNESNLELIGKPTKITDIDKWYSGDGLIKKGTPFHCRGSLIYNSMISKLKLDATYQKINNGDKIKSWYLKEPNPVGSYVICAPDELPEEFELEDYIDKNLQFNKTFLEPIESLAAAAGILMDDTTDMDQFL